MPFIYKLFSIFVEKIWVKALCRLVFINKMIKLYKTCCRA